MVDSAHPECCNNIRRNNRGPLSSQSGARQKVDCGIIMAAAQRKQVRQAADLKIEIAPVTERENLINNTLWMFTQV